MGKGSRSRARRSAEQEAITAVPVAYEGPAMSPWAAAWAWSEAIALHDLRHHQKAEQARTTPRKREAPEPLSEMELMYITRALTCAAQHGGIDVQRATVDSPAALAGASLALAGGEYLTDDLSSTLMWLPHTRHKGALPRPGDPGFERYTDLQQMLYTGTDRTAAELTDPENPVSQEITRNIETCARATRRAGSAVLGASLAHAENAEDAVPVGRLAHLLNEHLAGVQE